jgi:hypothetical protein
VAEVLVHLDAQELRPLMEQVVREVLAQLEADHRQIGDDVAPYSEPEAAARLGMLPHQLRDERRRGRIGHCRIVGNRVRYTDNDLRKRSSTSASA